MKNFPKDANKWLLENNHFNPSLSKYLQFSLKVWDRFESQFKGIKANGEETLEQFMDFLEQEEKYNTVASEKMVNAIRSLILKMEGAMNFDIRITREVAINMLTLGLPDKNKFSIMCKEYGDDEHWNELVMDDLDEDGLLDEDWQIIEIWLNNPDDRNKALELIGKIQAEI